MRTNLTCESCRKELPALVDGAIHSAVARALLSHVESCADCRARLEDMNSKNRAANLPPVLRTRYIALE